MSFDKSQIAYLDASYEPVIIRVDNGETITTLSDYQYPTQMEWAKDRLTLIILWDRKVYFHGTPLDVIQPESYSYYDEIGSFSMNSIGDQAYFKQLYNDQQRFEFHSTSQGIDEEYLSLDGDRYDYVDFYDNTGSYLLAAEDYYDGGYSQVACLLSYNYFASYSWDGEPMNSPEFGGESEILLYGTLEYGVYQIKGVYLGTAAYEGHGTYDVLTAVLERYPSDSPIDLDWVH